MSKKFLPYITYAIALGTASIAAYYSVTGLTKLFGNSIAVGLMAGVLELAKIILTSVLYQYWKDFNKLLKYYLTIAVVILAGITSIGIYGYLSATYEQTKAKDQVAQEQLKFLETKRELYQIQLTELEKTLTRYNATKNSVLNTSTLQYTDRRGYRTVRANTQVLKHLDSIQVQEAKLIPQKQVLQDSIQKILLTQVSMKIKQTNESELGALNFIAARLNTPLETVVNWLIIAFIFVFDPLAIALMLAANTMVKNSKTKPQVPKDTEELESVEEQLPEPEIPQAEHTPRAPYADIQENPNFTEWKKKQLIGERMRQSRVTEEGKIY